MRLLFILFVVSLCGCKDKTEVDTPAKWYRIPPTKVLWGKDTLVMEGYSLNPVDSFTSVSAINGCSHCSFYLKPDTVYVHDTIYKAGRDINIKDNNGDMIINNK